MLSFLRPALTRFLTPLARVLVRVGLSPTMVTVGGAAGVVLSAICLLPGGHFLIGSGVLVVLLLADGLDGTMARLGGRQSALGGYLDSTLDRISDGTIFGALALWAAGQSRLALGIALAALVLGQVVSYSRARAEVEGWDASVGIMERADRLVLVLLGMLIVGLGGTPFVLIALLGLVALGSAITVVQRIAAAARASCE